MSKQKRWGRNEPAGPGKRRLWWPAKPDPVTGKRRRPSKVIEGTYEDGELELARIRIALEGTSGDETWGEFWAGVVDPSLEEDGLKPKTKSEYRRLWRAELEPRIAGELVRDLDYDRACDVIADIRAPTVQRSAKRLWKKMANMAVRKKILSNNPIDRTIKTKPHRKRRKRDVDAEQLMPYLGRLWGTRYFKLALLMCGGGLRVEESAPLMGTDFSERIYRGSRYCLVSIERALPTDEGRKSLQDTKTDGSERTQWFAEPLASLLLGEIESDGPLFPGPRPESWSPYMDETWFANPKYLAANWKGWCERHKVPYVWLGSMRTVYSNRQSEAGSPDSVVSMAMGHSDGTTRGDNYMAPTTRAMSMIATNLAALICEEYPCLSLYADELMVE